MLPLSRLSVLAAFAAAVPLFASTAAQAAPPNCPGGTLWTAPGQRLELGSMPCWDPDNDTYTLQLVTPPSHGTIETGPGGGLAYVPAAGFRGADSFSYKATDMNGEESAVATVNVLVDSAPVCKNLSLVVVSGQPLPIPQPCADPDGDALTLNLDPPLHGVLEDTGSGPVYRSFEGYVGPDGMEFYSLDPFGLEGWGTVTLTVVMPKPVVVAAPQSAPPRDQLAPLLSVVKTTRELARARRRGLLVTVESSEPARVTIELTVSRATARKLGLARRPTGDVTVGAFTADLPAGESAVRVRLSDRARRAFRKLRKVRVGISIDAQDAVGNVAQEEARVTLKRS